MAAPLKRRSPRFLRIARITSTIALGLALVTLPTVFALFPHLAALPRYDRWRILVTWLVVAVIAGAVTTRADDSLHLQMEQQRATSEEQAAAFVVAEQRSVLRERIRGLLEGSVIPPGYRLTLYAPSPDRGYLIPVFPRVASLRDPAIFPATAGAVGTAWQQPGKVIVVTGDDVAGARHGLTPLQQDCYRGYAVVAAVSVATDDQPMGVLSALSRTHSGYFDEGGAGVTELRELAAEMAWILPEAIRWMLPTEEEIGL